MYTVTHSLLRAKTGEPVKITFSVKDQNGNAVIVTGATATYKIARRIGETALLTKTDADGITLDNDTAVVEFNASELVDGATPLLGDFFGQLKIVKSGLGLIVAEGPLSIGAVIF